MCTFRLAPAAGRAAGWLLVELLLATSAAGPAVAVWQLGAGYTRWICSAAHSPPLLPLTLQAALPPCGCSEQRLYGGPHFARLAPQPSHHPACDLIPPADPAVAV